MAGFYIYETETFLIQLNKENVLKDAKKIIVSIYQKSGYSKSGIVQIDKDESELGLDIDNSTITVSLSQEETSKFRKGEAEIQVNIYYENAERDVTSKATLEIWDNLYKKVINDG